MSINLVRVKSSKEGRENAPIAGMLPLNNDCYMALSNE